MVLDLVSGLVPAWFADVILRPESSRLTALQDPRPDRKPVEVCGPQPAQRPGHQPHQLVATSGVLNHPEQRHDVRDLGRGEQPAKPHDLHRQAGLLEGVDDSTELRTLAAQYRCCDSRGATARITPVVGDPGRNVLGLGLGGQQPGRQQPTGAGVGPGAKHLHVDGRLAPQRARGDVGRRKDGVVVAPARRQRQDIRVAGSISELSREAGQRRRARATPAVDRLVGVAHRGDRHRLTNGDLTDSDEEMPEQHQLSLTGVLELIEQNGPKPLAFHQTDVRETLRQRCGKGHLVREVEGIPAPFELLVCLNQRQNLTTGLERGHGIGHTLGQISRTAGPLGQSGDPGLETVDQELKIRRHQQVLGHLACQGHDRVDDGRRRERHVIHRPVMMLDDLCGELPGGRLGQQP